MTLLVQLQALLQSSGVTFQLSNALRLRSSGVGWLTLPSAQAYLERDAQCPRSNKIDLP